MHRCLFSDRHEDMKLTVVGEFSSFRCIGLSAASAAFNKISFTSEVAELSETVKLNVGKYIFSLDIGIAVKLSCLFPSVPLWSKGSFLANIFAN